MPRESDTSESASTTKCKWFPSTVNSITRRPNRSRASSREASISRKQRRLRRFQTWVRTRRELQCELGISHDWGHIAAMIYLLMSVT
jgi:hypothetical protein